MSKHSFLRLNREALEKQAKNLQKEYKKR